MTTRHCECAKPSYDGWRRYKVFCLLVFILLVVATQVIEVEKFTQRLGKVKSGDFSEFKDCHDMFEGYMAEASKKAQQSTKQPTQQSSKEIVSLEEYLQESLEAVGMESDPIPLDYKGYLDTLWTCSDRMSSLERKVIFVHVFKTAGSTFRTFFDSYGTACHKGTAVVYDCKSVSVESMTSALPDTPWTYPASNGDPEGFCMNKHTRERNTGDDINLQGHISGWFLQEHVDVMIGHLPIGVHSYWPSADSRPAVDAQYIAFFREPVEKYVSGRIFTNSKLHWTFDQAVQEIKRKVLAGRASGDYYNGYWHYLLTPEQKEQSSLAHSDHGAVQLIKQNLVDLNVLVGVVERMGESLSLMQSVLDVDTEFTSEFQRLDAYALATNSTDDEEEGPETPLIRNKSHLSTGDIVNVLKEDADFYPQMVEFLKYEYDLYDYALRLHKKQVEQMVHQHGNKYYFP